MINHQLKHHNTQNNQFDLRAEKEQENDFGDFQQSPDLQVNQQIQDKINEQQNNDDDFDDFQAIPVNQEQKKNEKRYSAFDSPEQYVLQTSQDSKFIDPQLQAHQSKDHVRDLYRAFDSPPKDLRQDEINNQQSTDSIHTSKIDIAFQISHKQSEIQGSLINDDRKFSNYNQQQQNNQYNQSFTVTSGGLDIYRQNNEDFEKQSSILPNYHAPDIQKLKAKYDVFSLVEDKLEKNKSKVLANHEEQQEDEFQDFQEFQLDSTQSNYKEQITVKVDKNTNQYKQMLIEAFPQIDQVQIQIADDTLEDFEEFQDAIQEPTQQKELINQQHIDKDLIDVEILDHEKIVRAQMGADQQDQEIISRTEQIQVNQLQSIDHQIKENLNINHSINFDQNDQHNQDNMDLMDMSPLKIEQKQDNTDLMVMSSLKIEKGDRFNAFKELDFFSDSVQEELKIESISNTNNGDNLEIFNKQNEALPDLLSLYEPKQCQQIPDETQEIQVIQPQMNNHLVALNTRQEDDFDDFEEAKVILTPLNMDISSATNSITPNQISPNIDLPPIQNQFQNLVKFEEEQSDHQIEKKYKLIQPIGSWREDINKVIGLEIDCLNDMIEELNQYGLSIYVPRVDDYKMLVEKIENLRLNKQKALESEQYEILTSIRDQLILTEEKARLLKEQLFRIRSTVNSFQNRNLHDAVNHYQIQTGKEAIKDDANPFISLLQSGQTNNKDIQKKLQKEITTIQKMIQLLNQNHKNELQKVLNDQRFKIFIEGTQIILSLCLQCGVDTKNLQEKFQSIGINLIQLTNEQAVTLIENFLAPSLRGDPCLMKRCSLLGTVILGSSITVDGKDYNQQVYSFMNQ